VLGISQRPLSDAKPLLSADAVLVANENVLQEWGVPQSVPYFPGVSHGAIPPNGD